MPPIDRCAIDAQPEPAQTAKKVLFVDDDPLMHRVYKVHLQQAGYLVIHLLDAENIVEVACREKPCVIIMDMMLPGTDGLAATLLLKSVEATKRIPVIAISANLSYFGLKTQLQSIGAGAFLSKPFGAAKLVAEILNLDKAPRKSDSV